MSKKLTKDVLNIHLGEVYDTGSYTLKDELSRFYKETNEDLIHIDYELCGPPGDENGYFSKFLAYSKTYILFLVIAAFRDKYLVWYPRNPKDEKVSNKKRGSKNKT